MTNSLPNNSLPSGWIAPQNLQCHWASIRQRIVPTWSAGILAALLLFGCSDSGTVAESDKSQSNAATELSNAAEPGATPVMLNTETELTEQNVEQTGKLPAAPQQESSGLMDKAGKLLNGAKQASGQGVAETGKWLKGTWDGATDTTGNAVEGSLDWANQTFKTLKDQGLTTASSTGQWLSEDWQNMESWQYKVLATSSVPAEQLEDKLNELGKQGWECFSIDDQRMIFKKASESYLRRLPFKDILRLAPLLNQGK